MLLSDRARSSRSRTVPPAAAASAGALLSSGAAAAVALLVVEAAVAALGGRVPALSAAVLVLAPGLALLPLLPARLRSTPLGAIACAPALGFAASSVTLITLARVGVPLTALSARLAVAAIVVIGALALRRADGATGAPAPLEALSLLAALIVAAVLAGHTLGGSPAPGTDWGKYLLYADEVRLHGSLLIQNPLWMLGQPFRDDPGVPSVLGPFAAMAKAGPATISHALWLFALIPLLSIFGYVRAYWGPLAAAVAAGLWAVLPVNDDILAWHGLANVAALGLFPILMAYASAFASERVRWREAAGAALLTVALAAAHRLSFLVAALALGGALVVVFARSTDRRRLARNGLRIGALVALAAPGVAADLVARERTFGGTQGYAAYLATKIDALGVVRDLTYPFAAVALLALVLLCTRRARRESLLVPICLLATVVALAYSWLVHLPLAYVRMAYYLPLALVPLVASVLVSLAPRRVAAAFALVLITAVGVLARTQDEHARRFYSFADAASLRGLDALAHRLRPGEVVATDRCWSFLSTWLLHTRTLPALESSDIQPKAELEVAEQARAVLDDSPRGREIGRRLGVRYILVDPFCADARGRPAQPPQGARAVYVSTRLAVFAR